MIIGYVSQVINDNNCLGLSDQEICSMSSEVAQSKTRTEIFNWCETLSLPEHVAAELIKRRHDARLRFDDDPVAVGESSPVVAPTTAKKGRHINAKGKRVQLTDKKNKGNSKQSSGDGGLKPGEFECGCFATVHKLKTNCLNCGRIICQQEGTDTCYFCGLEPSRCVAYEIEIQEGKISEAAQAKNKELYDAAIERRNRLLEYARNKAKRTAVIDDQQVSLFSPQNAWISPEERKQVEKDAAAEERRKRVEEMHRYKGAYTVHLDFVNKNVSLGALPSVEEATRRAKESGMPKTETDLMEEEEEEEGDMDADFLSLDARAEPSPSALMKIWYSTDGSRVDTVKAVRPTSKGDKKPEAHSSALLPPPSSIIPGAPLGSPEARRVLVVASKRVQQDYFEDDNAAFEEGLLDDINAAEYEDALRFDPSQFSYDDDATPQVEEQQVEAEKESETHAHMLVVPYAMRQKDEGVCLSMHQPWASLLVHGIKTHEGRGWCTNYRGRLWIHAASQQPIDISTVEAHYSQFVPKGTKFPEFYPTKVLLGSVYLMDCLDRESYEARYPPHERQEECPYSFICVEAVPLPFPLPMVGNHKLFTLEHKIHTAAKKQLGEIAV